LLIFIVGLDVRTNAIMAVAVPAHGRFDCSAVVH